jgi:cold shock CspA family protein
LQKDYGFLIAESTSEEFFVHKQQLLQAGTNMSTVNFYPRVKYNFQIATYTGKNGNAKKAVNLKIYH